MLVLWTKNSCVTLYSQDAAMPIDKVGVISRTTGNAPGDPSRLVLGITGAAFNDTFDVQLYTQHINAVNNTTSYREPVNTSVDAHCLLRHERGFGMANLIITELDAISIDTVNLKIDGTDFRDTVTNLQDRISENRDDIDAIARLSGIGCSQ